MADTCPKCGQTGVESDTYPGCGVLIPTYRASLDGTLAPKTRKLLFSGGAGTLFGMQIVNAFLTMVTFGIYYFWGKVKIRKYLFSQTEFEGDRFEYHGTGKELYVGAFKATLVFFLPMAVLGAVPQLGAGAVAQWLAQLGSWGLGLTLIAVAIVGSRRYRLSRTAWRGIRFSFRGQTVDFIGLFLRGSVLTVLTLSLYAPILLARQYAFLTSNAYFGNVRFGFDGDTRALLWPYVKFLLLAIPTLGLSTFWYLAEQQRYLWGHTTFGQVRFRSTVTGGGLLKLQLVNILLLVVTGGLAWPWVTLRKIRYRLDNLRLEGPIDLDAIQQEAQRASATGETVASFLDLDLIG